MVVLNDGPSSSLFVPIPMPAGSAATALQRAGISDPLRAALAHAPTGDCVCWGIPFTLGSPIIVSREATGRAADPVTMPLPDVKARWLVFLHTSDRRPMEKNADGVVSPMRGEGALGELACTYLMRYADGTEASAPIRRRFQVGCFTRSWGENCFESVTHAKPRPVRAPHEQLRQGWGWSQTRVNPADAGELMLWLYAWENPRPEVPLRGLSCQPGEGAVLLFGCAAGSVTAHPLRWETRRKALLSLPEGAAFSYDLDDAGLLRDIRLDLGQVISALPRPLYADEEWESDYNNKVPRISRSQVLLEYTAHAEACFHFTDGGATLPVADVVTGTVRAAPRASAAPASPALRPVASATRRVKLLVTEKGGATPVPVKLHVHGQAGEYLAPLDRHRIPNPAWFEDYSVDFVHAGGHWCTYINGETTLDLPVGTVFVEIARGFEIRPVRRRLEVDGSTDRIHVELERVLPWRRRGWVTADTHVHFLSPVSALLEGSAEGVNVVNLLASQWGELMTNVGDFDGATTWGSREAGGDGEHLVRVGTENRQHVLGHISLLGYREGIIVPMTTGGPDESALGDPVESLLTEWAQACRDKGGIVVVPHFPQPRAEHVAAIVTGGVDGVEMTSWGDLYSGIDPYSLSDWYRYLNCGYLVAAVGGTDKMSADTAVGTVRTYARIPDGVAFTYDEWMKAVRRAETFVTYGPLLEMTVDGAPMGSRLTLPPSGGSCDVEWKAASATIPMSRVELVVNGEIRFSETVDSRDAAGRWRLPVERSSWAALLVRGAYPDKPEIVAAHSSPVMVQVGDSPFFAAADALTILEQVEGALAYLDTVGTRAETAAYKRMRMVLESAHRSVHNRMHAAGHYHEHTVPRDHAEHHGR